MALDAVMADLIEGATVQTTTIRLENGEEREVFEAELVTRKDGVEKRKKQSVILNPKPLTVGEPHVFKLVDKYMVGVKSTAGNIDLYFFPDPADVEVAE